MKDSRELARVTAEARAIAAETGQKLSSAHLLFAFFTTPNPAELVLRARKVDEETLLAKVKEPPPSFRKPGRRFPEISGKFSGNRDRFPEDQR